MTNIIAAKTKYCRTVQGDIYGTQKYKGRKPPGQHGANLRKKKLTEYGAQMREKKKFRLFYNITERYLKCRFKKKIAKMRGNTGENLVAFAESLLSTVVYRANFASSIFAAKQLISHGHVLVNGKKVDISSFIVSPETVVSLAEAMRENHHVLNAISSKVRVIPPHLEADKFQVKFVRAPLGVELSSLYFISMNISSIVESLSK